MIQFCQYLYKYHSSLLFYLFIIDTLPGVGQYQDFLARIGCEGLVVVVVYP